MKINLKTLVEAAATNDRGEHEPDTTESGEYKQITRITQVKSVGGEDYRNTGKLGGHELKKGEEEKGYSSE